MKPQLAALFFSRPPRAAIQPVVETLVLASTGGLFFLFAHLPGGLISGAMIAVATVAIGGRRLALPPALSQSVLLLLGISLGSVVSRHLLEQISAYPRTILLLALSTFCSTLGSGWYLQRVHHWDRVSALLAGSPGALSQITIMAVESGADVAGIAVVQTMRVIILAAALPMVLALAGVSPAASGALAGPAAGLRDILILLLAAVALSLPLRLIRFPASCMFGAMISSGILHGAGWIEGTLPQWLRGMALIGVGALIGCSFARMRMATLSRHVRAALGSFAVAIAITSVAVALVMRFTDVRFSDLAVAFAPGAMDVMLALALTLHIDPIFVGVHHLTRFIYVTLATPGIVRLFGPGKKPPHSPSLKADEETPGG
ncbi:MAG: AbrB family transcriptional regulator [Alphaproteobacteria bacterium]|nr:AbrB family transcriptional regulator [Alphaproteobacteria bacterium]